MSVMAPDSAATEPRLPLPEHHRELEVACDALRVCTYGDDSLELVRRYRTLEHAVLEHIDAEETAILPIYGDHASIDAQIIREQHADIRKQLFALGVEVELHAVRAASIEALVARLRAHAAYEDRAMYAWAQCHLPILTRRELVARIARSLRTLAVHHDRPADEAVHE